jgi:hypothetical protein
VVKDIPNEDDFDDEWPWGPVNIEPIDLMSNLPAFEK